MVELTQNEVKVLNNISNERDPNVDLGDLLSEMAPVVPAFDTPVKYVAASKVLTISGVVGHGETVTISNPALGHVRDRYEFLTSYSQEVSEEGNIPVDIEQYCDHAYVQLTLAVQPTAGDKVTLGSKVYTWVPVGTDTADGEISIGADLAEAKLNFVAGVNGEDEFNVPHPLVTASNFYDNLCRVEAICGGSAGNSIVSTETFTSGSNVFSAGTLSLGDGCAAADAVAELVAVINAEDTQGVSATDGAGNTVVLTADEAGVAGNAITIAEEMPNGAFAGGATKLSGGITGTTVIDGLLMVDASYLYVYNGSDWRRISLGSPY